MARCKYIGQSHDQFLPTGEQCDQEARLTVDKSKPSKVFKTSKYIRVFHPTIKCPSGMCNYHYNKIRFHKLGVGRQS